MTERIFYDGAGNPSLITKYDGKHWVIEFYNFDSVGNVISIGHGKDTLRESAITEAIEDAQEE